MSFGCCSSPSHPFYRALTIEQADEEDEAEVLEISCPVNDPDCLGGEGDCHDACEPPAEQADAEDEEEDPWEQDDE